MMKALRRWPFGAVRSGFPALLFVASACFAPAAADLLMSPEELAEKRGEVLVLAVDTAADAFEAEHIAGAGFLPYGKIVQNRPVDGGLLITEIPPADELGEILRTAGVRAEQRVVLYGNPVLASRAFLTLEQMGHRNVALLDGGLDAWKESGGEVETGPTKVAAGNFEPAPRDDILVDAPWVEKQRTDDTFALVDARPLVEFTGADGGRSGRFKTGHIPGAANLYWEEMVEPDGPRAGRFLDEEALRSRLALAGLDEGETMVSYCFIGMRASVNYFLARHLGYEAKFYDGSWNDWSLTDYPAETGPDPRAPLVERARRDENGTITLFDGYTLNGWKANENPDSWTVEDGALTCNGPRSHLFFVGGEGEEDNTFTNFELSAEVRTLPGSNSGIYFHTRFQESGWPRYGYEAQVNLTHEDWKKSGSLYDVVNVREQLAEDGEWHTQTVRVEGRKVTIKVNGKVAVEYTEPEGKEPGADFERLLGSGTFAFQSHDPESKVQFRKVRVKRLD
ncbi:MAG: family 16 glycoside hydrolase [Acidobacteriota bacterium]